MNAPITFIETFLSQEEASSILLVLLSELELKQEKVIINGQIREPSRTVDFRGDKGLSYTYSGVRKSTNPWTETLVVLKRKVENEAGASFNACLCNFYPNGKSSMGWHSDDERELGSDPIIASLSLGAGRDFGIRRKNRGVEEKAETLYLPHGSLLIMNKGMQSTWEHCVPKRTKIEGSRLNLTFRLMTTKGSFRDF